MMDELARIGLVGTSRHTKAGVVDGNHPADAILAALQIDDRERQFLLNAGIRAVFQQCGQTAMESGMPPSPSPPELRPFASSKVVDVFRQALEMEPPDVFIEYLCHLNAIGRLLPPEILPQALSVKTAAIRKHVVPVLGERGRWLAKLNPDWQWVMETAIDNSDSDMGKLIRVWEEGRIEERCQVMKTLRRIDPSDARRRLEEAIVKEKADHRARLVETFALGLCPEDEILLESFLDDRSEQVRRSAAACLAQLPGSALANRMIERAGRILSLQKQGLLRKSMRLVCNPPEEIHDSWIRDGVPAKPPTGRGKRAVWTEAILSAIPPTLWSERFGLQPAELIEAIAKDEFAEAVIAGWTRASTSFTESIPGCAAWLYPLAIYWMAAVTENRSQTLPEVLERLQCLLPKLTCVDAELALLDILRLASSGKESCIITLLSEIPRPWTKKGAAEYLSAARSIFRRAGHPFVYQWSTTLKIAAIAFPRESFAAALESWTIPDAEKDGTVNRALEREIGMFTDVIRMRASFYRDVDAETPS